MLAVGLGLALTSACTSEGGGKATGSLSPTQTTEADFAARLDPLLAAVNKLQDATAIVSVPARPTVVQRVGGVQTMVIQDEDRGAWSPGTYRLVVRCAGEGSIVAHFSIDGNSIVRQLTPCAAAPSTDVLELKLTQPGKRSVVVLIPAGESMAAVGYQIQRSA